jgi:hypothetical protein
MSVQEDRDAADLRARELFHYFQPDNPALMPTGPHATRSCEYPIQKTSPNLVLTALAQLAALKLGVQRTVIRYDFLDRNALGDFYRRQLYIKGGPIFKSIIQLRSPHWIILPFSSCEPLNLSK